MREPLARINIIEDVYSHDAIFYSYIHLLSKGRSIIAERRVDKELLSIFSPVIQDRLTYNKSQGLMYRKGKSVIHITQASALAGEVSGIFLPVIAIPPSSFIIIEEPESQLHYSAHVLMGLTLVALASKYNNKIMLSTHSDLMVLILAYIKKYKPTKSQIIKLIKDMLNIQKISIKKKIISDLAEAVSQSKNLNINFYYYEFDKYTRIHKQNVDDIIKNISSLTDVIDSFASWALKLK